METEKVLNISVITIVLIVILLVALTIADYYDIGVFNELTGVDLAFDYENFPCLYACYTRLNGTELALLNNYFGGVRGSEIMIDYFPCNFELISVATMFFELAKWSVEFDGGLMSASQRMLVDYYEVARSALFDCLTVPSLCDDAVPVNYFCELDSYLYSFLNFPCDSYFTVSGFIDPRRSYLANRNGTDIYNDFLCTKGGPYDLCASGPAGGYGEECRPAWVTLKGFYEGGSSYGRCEDFAILYYSLFRAVGVPVNELKVDINYCDLPCPCKKLVQLRNELSYEEVTCAYPANTSVFNVTGSDDWDVIQACEFTKKSEDINWEEGVLRIYAADPGINYEWYINQTRYGFNNATYSRTLIFDDDPSNDISTTNFNFTNTTGYYGFIYSSTGDPCDNYPVTSIAQLAAECDYYLIEDGGRREVPDTNEVTYCTLTDFIFNSHCS